MYDIIEAAIEDAILSALTAGFTKSEVKDLVSSVLQDGAVEEFEWFTEEEYE